MHCRNCNAEVFEKAEICVKCGAKPLKGDKYCQQCGAETNSAQELCLKCGVRLRYAGDGRDWLTTLLLAIFLGWLGVHRFYTGHTLIGIVIIVTCGGFFGIWPLIDIILIAAGSYKDKDGNPLVKN
jgi:ribosomal protein L40E